MTEHVQESIDYCRRVTRTEARNFYYGLRLTPEPKRSALYVVYAFMRACDDLADMPPGTPAEVQDLQRAIDGFKAKLDHALGDEPFDDEVSIWPAVRHVLRAWPINPIHLRQAIDGQQRDLTQHRYETFDDLYSYCCQVAGTVGQVCIEVWGYQGGEETQLMAERRGVALQLTNILRDLPEDAGRGRVYLPGEDLARFGYDADSFLEELTHGHPGERFVELVREQSKRARGYYDASLELESRIERDCRATSWVMARIYSGLLRKIEKNPGIMLRRRVRLRTPTKLALGVRALSLAPAGRL